MRHSVFVCGIILLTLWGYFAPVSLSDAQMSQSYVVQYGDTLWDIAGTHLGNPYRWRDIHQNNPFITNPNLIYPGDILGLPTGAGLKPGQTAGQPGRKSEKQIARPWYGVPAPEPEKIKAPVSPNPIIGSNDYIESVGYIAPYSLAELEAGDFGQITGMATKDGETNAKVLSGESQFLGFSYGDVVYINRGSAHNIREGDVFVIFRPRQELRHPITSELVGTQIEVLGRLRIKTLEPEIACAEIIKSYHYIEVGNPIIPASELSLPLQKPLVGNARSYGFKVGNQLIAHILAERIGRWGLSRGDVVFIDVGAAQGLQPADNLIIFREIGAGYPRQAIGRMTVLSVQKQTATAMITESVKMIEAGDKAALKR
jgi:hypothetical protein